MPVVVHFINVGIGNMSLIHMPDSTTFLVDCNVTEENKEKVLGYLKKAMGGKKNINIFVNSHRDADHMRGIDLVHKQHPIGKIWDSGVPGTTTTSNEYKVYMAYRREIGFKEIKPRVYWDYGEAKLQSMNSKDENLSGPNEQSIVVKVEYKGGSVLLAGDTNFKPWKTKILPYYTSRAKCSILLAAHHGSITFFDDPADEENYYTAHIKKINPEMTIISVGPNVHGLPDENAIKLYEKHTTDSKQGHKIYTTKKQGNMRLTMKDEGGWSLSSKQ